MEIKTDRYTLIHGDALEIMPDIRGMDLCVTDAPYLLTNGGRGGDPLYDGSRRMSGAFAPENYNNSGHLFEGECPDWSEFTPLIFNCLRDNAHYYSMADSKNQFAMQQAALNAGFRFHNLLYWDKVTCTPNRWYMKNAEYIGFFFKGKAFPINDCSNRQGIRLPHTDETSHPTEKPVALMQHYIVNSSLPDEITFDPFMGTGTTGVAAIRSGRRFIGIERDKKWFDIAAERIKNAERYLSLFDE